MRSRLLGNLLGTAVRQRYCPTSASRRRGKAGMAASAHSRTAHSLDPRAEAILEFWCGLVLTVLGTVPAHQLHTTRFGVGQTTASAGESACMQGRPFISSQCPTLSRALWQRLSTLIRVGDTFLQDETGTLHAEKKKMWFGGGPALDEEVRAKFGGDLKKAAAGEMDSWRGHNGLAAVILQDQLSRNCHRGTPEMYDYDERALTLAKTLQEDGSLAGTPIMHRFWLVYPQMHCESLQEHELGIQYSQTLQREAESLQPPSNDVLDMIKSELEFAHKHKACIEAWGRYPHRNKLLGRPNTPKEDQGFKDNIIPAW